MKIRASIFMLLAVVANAAIAQNCKNPQTQLDMNVCSGRDFEREDKLLNKVYGELRSKLDATEKEKLKNVQVAWLKYRDLACEYEGAQYEGGSMQPLIFSSCKAMLTADRRKMLENLIKQ